MRANDAAWRAHIAARVEGEERFLAAHPGKDAADPSCADCDGTGTYTSTYSKASKWDWWVIGGRWSGHLTEDGRNVFPLTDLRPGWSVFAIVTPDGAWHAEADMGWFAITRNEDETWHATQYEIASAFPDHLGTLCDLHV